MCTLTNRSHVFEIQTLFEIHCGKSLGNTSRGTSFVKWAWSSNIHGFDKSKMFLLLIKSRAVIDQVFTWCKATFWSIAANDYFLGVFNSPRGRRARVSWLLTKPLCLLPGTGLTHISQPPLQLSMTIWLNSAQYIVGESDRCHLDIFFYLSPFLETMEARWGYKMDTTCLPE